MYEIYAGGNGFRNITIQVRESISDQYASIQNEIQMLQELKRTEAVIDRLLQLYKVEKRYSAIMSNEIYEYPVTKIVQGPEISKIKAMHSTVGWESMDIRPGRTYWIRVHSKTEPVYIGVCNAGLVNHEGI